MSDYRTDRKPLALIDVGPAVNQRLIEAMGGRLRVRQGRHELSFQITLPPALA
jgi:hypothetical protein